VEEVLQEGQEIEVFVAGIDKQGRVKLEWKDKPQAEAKEVEGASVSATFLTMEEQSEEINSGNKISEEEE
ncbi:TPA: hypothetical protein JBJ86_16170, partial [Legionella pneumophila]|nr:hypothetical protein [Legionella pneumophila]